MEQWELRHAGRWQVISCHWPQRAAAADISLERAVQVAAAAAANDASVAEAGAIDLSVVPELIYQLRRALWAIDLSVVPLLRN